MLLGTEWGQTASHFLFFMYTEGATAAVGLEVDGFAKRGRQVGFPEGL